MAKADMTTNLFDEVTEYLEKSRRLAANHTSESYSSFAVPAQMSFHAKEVLAAVVHAMDQNLDVNAMTRHMVGGMPKDANASPLELQRPGSHHDGYLYFNQPYETLPANQMLEMVRAMRKELQQCVTVMNDGAVQFVRPPSGRFDIDFLVRAALPVPHMFAMEYLLPTREGNATYRNSNGDTIAGGSFVNHDELMDIIGLAEFDSAASNYASATDLRAAKCTRVVVPADQAKDVATRLGLSINGAEKGAA